MSQIVVNKGVGPMFLLFLVFLVLKLTHHIAWSWVWVVSPLWIPASIVIGFFAVIFLVGIVAWLLAIPARLFDFRRRPF